VLAGGAHPGGSSGGFCSAATLHDRPRDEKPIYTRIAIFKK
jgi:hypothetical protein